MFVIKNRLNGHFIDLDLPREGYPCETDLFRAKKWSKLEDAKGYFDLFKGRNENWIIEELVMETRPLQII